MGYYLTYFINLVNCGTLYHHLVIALSLRFVAVLSSCCHRAVIVSGVERLVRQCRYNKSTRQIVNDISF